MACSVKKKLCDSLLKCLPLILIVTYSSSGAHLHNKASINPIEVILLPNTSNESFVPEEKSSAAFPRVVLPGENLGEVLWVALTKEAGVKGQNCESKEFLTPVVRVEKFGNESDFIRFSIPFAVPSDIYSDCSHVWVCITDDTDRSIWVHQGAPSRFCLDDAVERTSPETNEKNWSKYPRKPVKKPENHTTFRLPEPNRGTNSTSLETSRLNLNSTTSERTTLPDSVTQSIVRTRGDNPVNIKNQNSTNYFYDVLNAELNNKKRNNVDELDWGQPITSPRSEGNPTSLSRGNRNVRPSEDALLSNGNVMASKDAPLTNDSMRPGKAALLTNAVSEELASNEKASQSASVRVYGMRVESHSKGISYDDGVIQLQANHDALILLLGSGLTERVAIQFTANKDEYGGRCDASTTDFFQLESANDHFATVKIRLPEMESTQSVWYLCVRDADDVVATHQGSEEWLTISTYSLFLPLWIQIIFLVFLLILSGLFSGLNLGLMALDKTELKIVMNTGTPTERSYAKSIEPVRRHGNFLLCTLLLGNVLVNSTLTILLDTLSSGLIAVIVSTIGIVIFGEIVPQAICSRHGLAIGAKTVWLVRIFMVITGVVSWPVSKILDILLGEEIGNTYDRERLKELIRVTQDRNDIRLEEQNIIYGALELHRKTVSEVMTKLDDIYMLNIERSLDFNTINEIMQQGYSRIPIYEGERTNIVSLLLIKDLAFIDPDDNTPLRTVIQFYQNTCNFVFEDTTLDVIFKEFKEGNKGHMAFVQRVNNEGDCDPFYEVIGLVTLEDVIEELIQEEIVDETDVFLDNKSKRRRKHIRRDFKEFSQQNSQGNQKKVQISPQMQVAAFQYLRTSVEPFKEGNLSEGILKRMLNQEIIHVIKNDPSNPQTQNFIFVQGKAVDFFVLILEGHVEVTIGKENLTFESGPFTYFGLMALTLTNLESPSLSTQLSRSSIVGSVQSLDSTKFCFTPDYSVKASTEVTYLKVKRSHYIAARRAYLLEQSQRDPLAEETFEKEVEKILRDESLTSPVWETNSNRDEDSKDGLLNGGAVVAKEDDQIEMSIVADGRRLSLRETLVVPRSAVSNNNSPESESEQNGLITRNTGSSSASGRKKPDSSSPTTVCI